VWWNGGRTTDVLTFAFRMWRCRLCMAENGSEMKLSEPQASLLRFPFFFDLHRRVPVGQRLCVAFFCFRFLAKQEKGVAAGLPPASNLTSTKEVKTRPGHRKPKTACRQRAYSMRATGLCARRSAWNMGGGVACFEIPCGAIRLRLLTPYAKIGNTEFKTWMQDRVRKGFFEPSKYRKVQLVCPTQNGIVDRAFEYVGHDDARLHVKLLAILRTHRLQSPV
jgi:hypothetical protein